MDSWDTEKSQEFSLGGAYSPCLGEQGMSSSQFLLESKLELDIKPNNISSQFLLPAQGYSSLRSQLKHHFLEEVFFDPAA